MSAQNQSTEPNSANHDARKSTDLVLGTALTLCAFLLVIRAQVIGWSWKSAGSTLADLPMLLATACYDFFFVAVLTCLFVALVHVARNRTILHRAIYCLFFLAALVSLLFALVNIKFIQTVGRPFNYQWLYYSDFLKSMDARQAIRDALSWKTLLLAAAAAIGMLAASRLLGGGIGIARRRFLPGRSFALCLTGSCLLYFPLAFWDVHRSYWDHARLENPVVSFLSSVVARRQPPIFTMKTPVGPEDFQVASERSATHAPARHETVSPIRNVLLFVFESVPTEYLEAYGGVYPVTPELNRYRKQWMLFRRIYVPAPATNKSMLSMLCSIYPDVSYRSLTQEHPDADLPSLSSELKQQGYRTAFFSSSDNQYQSVDKFLAHRQFDVVQDYRSRRCDRQTFIDPNGNRDFLNGSDDECAADSLIEWVNAGSEKPFFAMMWTMMTHYPYFVSEPETDFGVKDEYFNRYLNALRHGDRCLGKILRVLEDKGLADSTLVIVMGDHGEAFGRHHQLTHACKIYEENVHAPLILINRQLFQGEESSVLGSTIDLAPTVMELLHLPSAGSWQGRSLFGQDRSPRVYFFATWSEFLFGYREGDRKCIFNASENQYEVYDLRNDPQETANLADRSPEVVAMIPQRLAAWVQYQNNLIERAVSRHTSH